MNVQASRCALHLVHVLKPIQSLTEIYECNFSAQLYTNTADGSHGQYMLTEKCTNSASLSIGIIHAYCTTISKSEYVPAACSQ